MADWNDVMEADNGTTKWARNAEALAQRVEDLPAEDYATARLSALAIVHSNLAVASAVSALGVRLDYALSHHFAHLGKI